MEAMEWKRCLMVVAAVDSGVWITSSVPDDMQTEQYLCSSVVRPCARVVQLHTPSKTAKFFDVEWPVDNHNAFSFS